MNLEAARPVLRVQGTYFIATGISPFVSRRAFEALTGPKREWWLVQTVGGLVTVVGATLLAGTARDRSSPELTALAAGSAAVLAAIDVAYVAKRRIAPTYLVDAAIELGLLGAVARGLTRRQAPPESR